MTRYEIARLILEPFLPVLCSKVRRDLKQLIRRTTPQPASILDVGGRKSPYTIGLPVAITLLDLPRKNELQHRLHLGLTDEDVVRIQRCRSNIVQIVLEDMTRCTLPSNSFDGVICVEVIEHVRDDVAFIEQIERVLRPGGWLYLTTPNGDYVKNVPPNYNPDHVQHYTRQQLLTFLSRYFERVTVTYGVKTGKYRYRGLKGIDLRRPWSILEVMTCNVISHIESRGLEFQSQRTAHLFAVAWKGM